MKRRDFLRSVSGDRGGRLPCRHLCYDRLVTGETKNAGGRHTVRHRDSFKPELAEAMNFERHVGQLQTRKNANSTDVTPVTAGPQTVGGHERPVRLAHSNVMRLSCDCDAKWRIVEQGPSDRVLGDPQDAYTKRAVDGGSHLRHCRLLIPDHRWKKDGC